ncbi:hypothetical protein GGS24DRAFT_455056 [Hypoxylon argillaceum]|nr:hypothetical protein GGS24DRAFT_455056 [Hypoxylon argillaceum]
MVQEWQNAPEVTGYSSYPEVCSETFSSVPTHGQPDDRLPEHVVYPAAKAPEKTPEQHPTRRYLKFVVPILIFLLFAAVVGLAAGVGVLSRKANAAELKVSSLLSNLSNIDRGCSTSPESATGTFYTSQSFGQQSFKILCNTEVNRSPLQSLFVSNFDECIDACASYSTYTAGNFPNYTSSANFTCNAVSFITQWTNRSVALANNAPGNCYLKPGPFNSSTLGTGQVNVAILQTGSGDD